MGNERRKSNSFYQNLENQDENETWIFTSPTQKRKLWFISLQEFLEIQTLVKVCIPPLWTNKTTQTANYNDSLAIERKSTKEKTITKPLFPPFVGAKQILTLKNCSQSPSSPPSPLSIQGTPIIDIHHQGQMYALYIRTSYTHVSGSRIIDACSIYASHHGYIHHWYIHHRCMHHASWICISRSKLKIITIFITHTYIKHSSVRIKEQGSLIPMYIVQTLHASGSWIIDICIMDTCILETRSMNKCIGIHQSWIQTSWTHAWWILNICMMDTHIMDEYTMDNTSWRHASWIHVSRIQASWIQAPWIYASHQGYIHNWYIHHGYMHHQNMQHESMHHMCMHHIYTHNRRMHHGYMHRIMIHAAWTHASWYKWCIGIEEDKEVNIGWVTQPERLTSQKARRASS